MLNGGHTKQIVKKCTFFNNYTDGKILVASTVSNMCV